MIGLPTPLRRAWLILAAPAALFVAFVVLNRTWFPWFGSSFDTGGVVAHWLPGMALFVSWSFAVVLLGVTVAIRLLRPSQVTVRWSVLVAVTIVTCVPSHRWRSSRPHSSSSSDQVGHPANSQALPRKMKADF